MLLAVYADSVRTVATLLAYEVLFVHSSGVFLGFLYYLQYIFFRSFRGFLLRAAYADVGSGTLRCTVVDFGFVLCNTK